MSELIACQTCHRYHFHCDEYQDKIKSLESRLEAADRLADAAETIDEINGSYVMPGPLGSPAGRLRAALTVYRQSK